MIVSWFCFYRVVHLLLFSLFTIALCKKAISFNFNVNIIEQQIKQLFILCVCVCLLPSMNYFG